MLLRKSRQMANENVLLMNDSGPVHSSATDGKNGDDNHSEQALRKPPTTTIEPRTVATLLRRNLYQSHVLPDRSTMTTRKVTVNFSSKTLETMKILNLHVLPRS